MAAVADLIEALTRKVGQVAGDPVLRRWLIGRMIGRHAPPANGHVHRPPYLELDGLPAEASPTAPFEAGTFARPENSIDLPLPGGAVSVLPGREAALFERSFDDLETLLAVHRFAWVPVLGHLIDPAWVAALWRAWTAKHETPDESWAWHPYTAAERAINLLDFARRFGTPEPADRFAATLGAHAPAILKRLEYFGSHNTSNHLSNNGRGLFRLGLALGVPEWADIGARILLEEAKRIFLPSGMLREDSSHYQLLLARNYADAWLAARAAGRPEAGELEAIVTRVLSVIPRLALPGGFPLIGDVSPDCPPAFLAGLLPGANGETGWTGLLEPAERTALLDLAQNAAPAPADALPRDGWLRRDIAPWAGLWHAAVDGWPAMPGHGHQDCGGFELHCGDEPAFVDPGRRRYGDSPVARADAAASAHSTLTVDGADPYPTNKPYYDDAFRTRMGGPPPVLEATGDGVRLRHEGYRRLGGDIVVERVWRFTSNRMEIADRIEGTGTHRIDRRLVTLLPAEAAPGGAMLKGRRGTYRVTTDGGFAIDPAIYSPAYGESLSATALRSTVTANLPWNSVITVETA